MAAVPQEEDLTMTIKVHTFRWVETSRLGIKPNQLVGHLYSDVEDLDELQAAAATLRLPKSWLQLHDKLVHYDVWGYKLTQALQRYPEVEDHEFVEDMRGLRV